MDTSLRRATIAFGLVLAFGLGWIGYVAGAPLVQYIYPEATRDEARLLAALLFGSLGLFLGTATGGPRRDVVSRH